MKYFEQTIYKLIESKIEIKDLEQWVYSEKRLEDLLSSDDYLELISLNYRLPSSLYEAQKIFEKYIDYGTYYECRLRRVLQKIIDQPTDVHKYIEQCYDMYCHGYSFLDNLGLGYGLAVAVPSSKYTADSWDKLESIEQKKIIGNFYPGVRIEAKKVLYWIDSRKIILTGYDGNCQCIQYEDTRTPEEKEPTAYKLAKLDNK